MGAILSIASWGERGTTERNSNQHIDQTELQRPVTQATTPSKQEDILERSASSTASVDGEQGPYQPRGMTTSHEEDNEDGEMEGRGPSENNAPETDRMIAHDTTTTPLNESEFSLPRPTTTTPREEIDNNSDMHQESAAMAKSLALDGDNYLMLPTSTGAGSPIDNGIGGRDQEQSPAVLSDARKESANISASELVMHRTDVAPSDQETASIERHLQTIPIDIKDGGHSRSGLLQSNECVESVLSTVHDNASPRSSHTQEVMESKQDELNHASAMHNAVLPENGNEEDVFAFTDETSSTLPGRRQKFQPRGRGKLPLRKSDKKRAANSNIDTTYTKKVRGEDRYLDPDSVEEGWPSYRSLEPRPEEQRVVTNELLFKSQETNRERYKERIKEISKRTKAGLQEEREEDERFAELTGWRRSQIG